VPPTARPAAGIVVDIAGAVRKPGVYTMAAGSRLGEAITRAGGAVRGADTRSLNLARLLVDGEQVLVPMPGQGGSPVGPAGVPLGPGSLIDLNTATLDQVEALPGVGPVLAQRILDWRREHGRFTSIDELREVSGIGEQKFHDLRDKVRV
jgi:competence protein ComEA